MQTTRSSSSFLFLVALALLATLCLSAPQCNARSVPLHQTTTSPSIKLDRWKISSLRSTNGVNQVAGNHFNGTCNADCIVANEDREFEFCEMVPATVCKDESSAWNWTPSLWDEHINIYFNGGREVAGSWLNVSSEPPGTNLFTNNDECKLFYKAFFCVSNFEDQFPVCQSTTTTSRTLKKACFNDCRVGFRDACGHDDQIALYACNFYSDLQYLAPSTNSDCFSWFSLSPPPPPPSNHGWSSGTIVTVAALSALLCFGGMVSGIILVGLAQASRDKIAAIRRARNGYGPQFDDEESRLAAAEQIY
eukprot:GEZU01024645.1.p1 GENE.GEZU01024645.1~~GEZU01024645.1.p1  ORF type:complete len:306 (+),score=43.44 GEZU01024645.1:783-1700(+)